MLLVSAQSYGASGITYTGRILDATTNAPLTTAVSFSLQVLSADANCLIYAETQALTTPEMVASNGTFSLELGNGSSPTYYGDYNGTAAYKNLYSLFDNTARTWTGNSCTFTPAATDGRILRVSFNTGIGGIQTLPDLKINPVPLALQAYKVTGFSAGDLLRVDPAVDKTTYANTALNQAQYNEFWKLLLGTSTTYLGSGTTFGGDVSGTYSALTVNKIKNITVDTTGIGNGKILKYDGTKFAMADDNTGATADSSYAAKGVVQFDTDAATSGMVVTTGVAKVNVGTSAGQIVQLVTGGKLPAVDGSNLTNVSASSIANDSVTSAKIVDGTIVNADISATAAIDWSKLNVAASDLTTKLGYTPLNKAGDTMGGALNMNGSNVTNVGALTLKGATSGVVTLQPTSTTSTYSLTFPAATPQAGQVLQSDATGLLSWSTPTAGLSTSLTNGSIYVGNGSNIATAVGVTGDISLSNAGATKLAAINGVTVDTTAANTMGQVLFYDSGATKWKVSATTAPTTTGQVLTWNQTNKNWEPTTPAASGWTAVDATYAQKGIVQFNTDAATSGVTVSSGTATVLRTTTATANQILSLDGSSIATAKGFAVNGSTAGTATIQAPASFTNYSLTLPSSTPSTGQVLSATSGTDLTWTTPATGVSTTLNSAKIYVGNASNVATAVDMSGDATISNTGVVTANKTTTGVASKLLALDASSIATAKGFAVNGSTAGTATLAAPASFTSYSLTLPSATPMNGQVLSATSGTDLTWTTPATGGLSSTLTTGHIFYGNASNVAVDTDPATNFVLKGGQAGALTLGTSDANTLTFNTNGTAKMAINSTGNVGVGVAPGSDLLTVAGVVNAKGVTVAGSTSGTAALTAPASFTSYSLTLPSATPVSGQVLSATSATALGWTTPSVGLSTSLNSAQVYVGNASNVGTAVGITGDISLSNAGATKLAAINGVTVDTTAAATMGQVLFYDSGASKWKVSASTAPTTTGQVMTWNQTNKNWEPTTPTAGWTAVDATYAQKGIVQFNTDATTSGVTVASGVATVLRTTTGTANNILSLDGSSIASAKGFAVMGSTAGTATIQAPASFTNYSLTLPAATPTTGQVLSATSGTALGWTTPTTGVSTTLNSAQIYVGNASNVATAVSMSGDATIDNAGVLTANKTTTGVASKLLALDASSVATAKSFAMNGATSGTATLTVPASFTSYSLTLPAATPAAGQVLGATSGTALGWTTPAAGLSTTLNSAQVYVGNASNVGTAVGITGDISLSNAGATKLAAINGVTVDTTAAATMGQVLFYDSGATKWKVSASTAPTTTGQVLTWNQTNKNWEPTTPAASGLSTTLNSALMYVGNASNVATAVAMSGDATIDNAGVLTANKTTTGVASKLLALDASSVATAKSFAMNGSTSGTATLTVPASFTSYSLTLPAATPAAGQVLGATSGTALGWTTPTVGLSTTLNSALMYVGNASNVATAVAMSGDATIDNAGVLTANKTTTGVASKLLALDASSLATAKGFVVNGSTSGSATLNAPASFTSYSLTLPSATPTTGQVLSATSATALGWTTPTAVVDSSYAAKGIVQFNTDATTSGVTVASGVATVLRTTTGTANNILSLDGSSIASAKGFAVMGSTAGTATIQAPASFTNYSLTLPAATPSAGQVLGATSGTALGWTTPTAGVSTTLNSAQIYVGNASNVATAVTMSGDATISNTGVITADKTTAGAASKLMSLDASGVANAFGMGVKGATSGTATLTAPSTFTSYSLVLPAATPQSGQVLSATSGTALGWTTPAASLSTALNSGYVYYGNASNIGTAIDAKGTFVMKGGQTGAVSLGTSDATTLSFMSNNSTRMSIESTNGYVGIGVNPALYNLQVTDGTTSPTIQVGPTTATSGNAILQFSGKASGTATIAKIFADYTSNLDYQPASGGSHFFKDGSGTDKLVVGPTYITTSGVLSVGNTYIEAAPATATSTATVTIPSTANIYRSTLSVASTQFTLPACPATTNTAFSLTVKVQQDATGGRLVTWNSSPTITWDSGTVPDPSTTASAVSIYQFLCIAGDSPSTWYGMMVWKAQ